MLYFGYNILFCLGFILAFPFLLPRLIKGRYRRVGLARLGFKLDFPSGFQGGIWVHALSVGEVRAAIPLVKALGERFSEKRLVFSTATRQGFAQARELCEGLKGVHVMVRPLDLPWVHRRMINTLRPCLAVLVESDIWPGWQWALGKAGIPRLLVNSRISPKTFKGYRQFRFFVRPMLNAFEQILVQSETDRERLLAAGVDPGLVSVGGNLKFDGSPGRLDPAACEALRRKLGLGPGPVLVAGSTHPGEEEKVLAAFKKIRETHPESLLILAPRRIERGGEAVRLARAQGFETGQYSEGPAALQNAVLVLDRLGLLAEVYALGQAAFVGGSWVDVGGHNLLEPAAQGVPVAFGPVMYNFKEMAARIEESGGGVRVKNAEELARIWDLWLSNPKEAEAAGQRGLAFCSQNRGAVARAVNCCADLLQINAASGS